MAAGLRIALFDGLTLEYEGRRVSRFRTAKTAILLAYLASSVPHLAFHLRHLDGTSRPMDSSHLARRFAGDSTPPRTRQALGSPRTARPLGV